MEIILMGIIIICVMYIVTMFCAVIAMIITHSKTDGLTFWKDYWEEFWFKNR